jgi:hypothetical protein
MTQQTEAACLLDNGAMYGKRALLCPESGDPIFAGFRPGVFSLYFGDAPIYHFDREGRWQRAFVEGTHYLKGLDTTIQAIDRVREGESLVLKRRTLGYAESSDLDAQVRAAALDVLDALNHGRLEPQSPPAPIAVLDGDELSGALEQVVRWNAEAWFAHRERYLETYAPLPILPPEVQAAVTLQATLGHACGLAFGRGVAVEHAVRTPREFEAHARAVRRLLGRRIEQCRGLFVAGADVLRQSVDTVAAYLAVIAQVFSVETPAARPRGRSALETEASLDGVITFLDDFTAPLPDQSAWRRYRELHLRRVILGVESGDAEVRALYGRHWSDQDLTAIVAGLKDAGLSVGVLALVDAGGIEHAPNHLAATAERIGSLPLGPGDLVSLLDANELCDPKLDAGELGFTPITGTGWAAQQAELKRRLLAALKPRGAKVATYSLEKQGV